jgi:hypothetical protein
MPAMTSAVSDLKVGFSIIAGFTLVYAACLWLDERTGLSADAEAQSARQGWVTLIPAPRDPASAVD